MGIIRRTQSVTLLLNEFKKDLNAISTIELIRRLSTKLNKTTIYRVLEKLEDDGILHSFLGKSGIRWYAKCEGCSTSSHVDEHPHFQCLSCGKIDCLPLNIYIPPIPKRTVETSQVLIQGKCEICFSQSV